MGQQKDQIQLHKEYEELKRKEEVKREAKRKYEKQLAEKAEQLQIEAMHKKSVKANRERRERERNSIQQKVNRDVQVQPLIVNFVVIDKDQVKVSSNKVIKDLGYVPSIESMKQMSQ